MMGTTHATIGAGVATTVALAAHRPEWAAGVCVAAAFGALLPDIDNPHATISRMPDVLTRPFRPLAFLIWPLGLLILLAKLLTLFCQGISIAVGALTGGHRGATHWAGAFLGVTFAIGYLLPFPYNMAVAWGYGSHILADMCTRSGVRAFWPFRLTHVTPFGYRLVTGGTVERVLRYGLLATFGALWATVYQPWTIAALAGIDRALLGTVAGL